MTINGLMLLFGSPQPIPVLLTDLPGLMGLLLNTLQRGAI